MTSVFRATVLFVVICSTAVLAQGRTSPAIADSSAARIMTRLGSQTTAVWLQNVLRQTEVRYPQAKLDEIGDSLARRAIDPASIQENSEAYTRALNAVLALLQAGIVRSPNGRPYAGAYDRLLTVHRQAQPRLVRRWALIGMLASSHSSAVDYLRRVAESNDSTAVDAVELLVTDANGGSMVAVTPTPPERQESVSALKALVKGGRVTERRATEFLELWQQRYRAQHPSGNGL